MLHAKPLAVANMEYMVAAIRAVDILHVMADESDTEGACTVRSLLWRG